MASSERSATPPHAGSQGSAQREGSSTIRSYLHPVTSLDDSSQDTLKSLLQVTVELRHSTSQIQRVQGGAPGNYTFGPILSKLRPQVNGISGSLEDIFTTCERFPGMYLVKSQFAMFKNIVNGDFYDDKGSGNHEERVHLLEKLMYVTGMLRGHLEMVLEQHSYWKAKLAGKQPPHLVRKFGFNNKIDPAPKQSGLGLWGGLQFEEASSEAVVTSRPSDIYVSSADSAHEGLSPSTQNTFKVSVCLPEEVQTTLLSLWENQKYTDITFLINGHPVPAHKAILASYSNYFEQMLYRKLREAEVSMDEITLQDVPLEAFEMVLRYVYSGTLHMKECTLQAILEVVAVADRFSFVTLKEALGDQLSRHISTDTVISLLIHSDTYHLPELHKKCLGFIESKSNTTDVLQSASFLDLPEEHLIAIISRDTLVAPESAIFQAVLRWKEHKERSAEELVTVLEHIRLTEFSPQEIFSEVEPTKLFSQESILTAVRLQHKPSLTETHPRGRKEANKNLFTKPTVVFDVTTPPSFSTLSKQGYCSFQLPPCQNVTDAVINLGFPRQSSISTLSQGAQTAKKSAHGSEKLDGSTIIVALDNSYIINYLLLKGYPGVSNEEQVSKSFSYTVKVSRDKSNWLELFDYSSFACRGAQHLPFPKQAARYIRVDLTGKQDATQPTPLQLSACCHLENQQPFKFLPKGVIAPQYELKVVTIPSTEMFDNNQVCVAYFRQPYSASLIKFHLKCSDPSVVEVDITVSVGVSSNLEEREVLQDMERTPLKSQVIVKMQERVIGYVAVTIRKLYEMIPLKPHPHEEVELHKAEQRGVLVRERVRDLGEKDKATNELYRKFQEILNKLTRQTFQALAEEALDLQIDTEERLKGVVDIIFTKAIEEPNFSIAYANLCKVLSPIQVEWTQNGRTKSTTFRRVLLAKCQMEFEKDKEDDEEREMMLAAIERAELEEQKIQLTEEMEEAETKAQRWSLGNIRFIGELFKVKMLSETIIHECILRLLKSSSDEKSLECFAQLITTTGKDLDHPETKPRIDNYFARIQDIIRKGEISVRLKFILEGVKKLRQNNWVPRNRQESSLKPINQDGTAQAMSSLIIPGRPVFTIVDVLCRATL